MTKTSDSSNAFELVVVGGGPGGATLATLVAMQGHRVLLLERERFPRYQIGESLLPSTVHGICRLLGVWDQIEHAGFVRKQGAAFRWGTNREPWTFGFSQAPLLDAIGANYAWQVERSKFDAILLDNARRKGVEVRERWNAERVITENERVVGIVGTDEHGTAQTVRARYVADASGNSSRLHKKVGARVYSKFFRNVALFCYFENAGRLPAPNEGNILCEAFDNGWIWYIPLSQSEPRLTSVGVVVSAEHMQAVKDNPEQAMRGFIDRCPKVRGMLANASRVKSGQYGEFRVRKDWSYTNERFWRPGLVLIGDAACFIDPVLSTGVHLATYSALLAARSINTCLRTDAAEAPLFEEFEHRYRSEFETFYTYLMAFYDMHRDEKSYFWSARKVLNTDEQANAAFVRLVAGGATASDIYFQGLAGMGDKLRALADQQRTDRETLARAIAEEVRPAAGEPNGTRKPVHAGLEDIRRVSWGRELQGAEDARTSDAFVPSDDGCHWLRVGV
jgi:halogenation protein CepH